MRPAILHLVVVTGLLLVPVFPLCAQWSGGIDLVTGLGGLAGEEDNDILFHFLVQGKGRIQFKSPKFTWNASVEGKVEPNSSDSYRVSNSAGKLSGVLKSTQTTDMSFQVQSGVSWTPSIGHGYSAGATYSKSFLNEENYTFNTLMTLVDELGNIEQYLETPKTTRHNAELSLRTFHHLESRKRVLHAEATLSTFFEDRYDPWVIIKENVGLDDIRNTWMNGYKTTPTSTGTRFYGKVHLQMDSLASAERRSLTLDPGVRFWTSHSLDKKNGATLDGIDEDGNEIWRDSTRLKESFDFQSVQLEPYISGDWTIGPFRIRGDYALQVYGRSLSNEEHSQRLSVQTPLIVGYSTVSWQITDRHTLTLGNNLAATHPGYIQTCWYDREGGYINQLYRGNSQLKSTRSRAYTLGYQFRYKGFTSTTTGRVTRILNEIDQTYFSETIDNREYKIFTWINSADSWVLGGSQSFLFSWKRATTSLGLDYKSTVRTAKNTGEARRSFDWRLNANAEVDLGKGWCVQTDIHYQSSVATFFTLFKQYCLLNVSVRKSFKHITLSFKAQDILDHPVQTGFTSADGTEFWEEVVRKNKRFFLLGFSWNF